MHTLVIGVRHRTAPIEVREKLAFTAEEIPFALHAMLLLPGVVEGAILATCNRTELYATVTDTELGIRSLKAFLKDIKGFDYNRNMQYGFTLFHEDAVMHLLRVASGLDSLVLGEGQIMAQVKEAYRQAIRANSSGEVIDKLFKTALTVGKAVRSETGIANRDNSVSRAAFEFAQTHYPQFLSGKIALIGAGKMAEILMSSLKQALPVHQRQPDQVVLVNRTPERVKAISNKYGFPGYGWEALPYVLQTYDTLFVATSSPHYVLTNEAFSSVSAPKVIIDISVPRNVDPDVAEIPNIQLHNTDDLSGYSGYTGENRVRLIQQAHHVIEREYQKYYQWFIGRNAASTISQLRHHVEGIRQTEISSLDALCPHMQKSCSIVDDLTRALVNKILHAPMVQLRATPQLEEIYQQAALLNRLFNLGEPHSTSDTTGEPDSSLTPVDNVLPLRTAARK